MTRESTGSTPLLERAVQLGALGVWARDAWRGGRFVLVAGEAGVGKTSLVRAFLDDLPLRTRVLQGACEALSTPHPLAPLIDVAAQAGGKLIEAVDAGAGQLPLSRALLATLQSPGSVLVIEDLHWADDATLDLVRLVSRRIGEVPALVVATYRDDEVGPLHPLRLLLGDLAGRVFVSRLLLEPLSEGAVAELAKSSDMDASALFRQTGGNPFFVSEVLAGGGAAVPETVRDAVLARVARLPASTRRALQFAAVIGSPVDLRLLHAVARDDAPHLDECVEAGLMRADRGRVVFRHEIARTAVEEAIPPTRWRAMHAAVLRWLVAVGDIPAARLAHHAEAAGDANAIWTHSVSAAEEAARLGSHREAAAQYRRALQAVGHVSEPGRARLLMRYSEECVLSDQITEATTSADDALVMWRSLGDRLREGDALRWQSALAWMSDRAGDAVLIGRDAIVVLEQLPPGPELARAYETLGRQYAVAQVLDDALPLVTRAMELAEALDERETAALASIDMGLICALRRDVDGIAQLEAAVQRAQGLGLDEHAAKGLFQLGRVASGFRRFAEAEERLLVTEAFCAERGVDFIRDYAMALRADIRLDLGDWDRAEELAREVWQRSTPASPTVRTIIAAVVLGTLHARRGTPDREGTLAIAARLGAAVPAAGMTLGLPTARAEAAWLSNRLDSVVAELRAARDLARDDQVDGGWQLAEVCWWLRVAGEPKVIAEGVGPFVAQAEGHWAIAAAEWEALGYPYHRAQALAGASEEGPLRESLEICRSLGAVALGARVTRRLHALGVRRIPRIAPRRSPPENPAGLTTRELDVLALLSDGMHDREIAGELVISERTVHHHVAEILRKLGCGSRTAAAVTAARLGLLAHKDG